MVDLTPTRDKRVQGERGFGGEVNLRTPIFSLLIFLLLLALAEVALTDPTIQDHLPAPSISNGYQPADIQFDELDAFVREQEGVDCLFIGSSMVLNGLNPMAFEVAYLDQTGLPIRCYNFGVQGLTAATAGAIAEVLVKKYQPRLLIYGTQARDFDGRAENTVINDFPQTPWMRYQRGDFNLEGWLLTHSHTYRYLNTLPEMLFPIEHWQRGVVLEAERENGYIPQLLYDRQVSPLFAEDYSLLLKDEDIEPVLSKADFAGLKQLIELSKQGRTTLLILEMPQFQPPELEPRAGSPEAGRQAIFRELMTYTRQQGVPFWTADYMNLLPISAWVDTWHLHAVGSLAFSAWLGRQVGAAMSGEMPLDHPPLDISIEANRAILPIDMRTVRDKLPEDALIFNPATGEDGWFLINTLTAYIAWSLQMDDSQEADLRYLLETFNRMQYEADLTVSPDQRAALTDWRATKQATFLRAAGIDYVIFSGQWATWLTPEERATLDSDAYEKIKEWVHPPLGETFYLFKVHG
jgi:hypothetical protein